MKYVNMTNNTISVEFKSYPPKEVQPGAVINLSENKYNNLKNKELRNLGFSIIKGSEYKKFMQSKEYIDLVKKREKKVVEAPLNEFPKYEKKTKPNK